MALIPPPPNCGKRIYESVGLKNFPGEHAPDPPSRIVPKARSNGPLAHNTRLSTTHSHLLKISSTSLFVVFRTTGHSQDHVVSREKSFLGPLAGNSTV